MRIAVNASILDDRPTGMGIYAASVIRELVGLVRTEDRLTVFTGHPEAFADCDIETVTLSRFTQPRYGKGAGIWRFLWSQAGLPLQARHDRFDLLYQMTHHGLPYRLPGLAQVLTIQTDVEVASEFPHQHRLQHYYFRHFVPRLVAASSAVITTSRYAMGVLERMYGVEPAKLHFAYNAYDPACFTTVPADYDAAVLARCGLKPKQYLLAVGATYPHKNIGALLRAFSDLCRAGSSLRLCIAGYRASYLTPLLRGLDPDLRGRIVAIPYLAQRDLGALYRGGICLVFPSFHESFGMPCVEAMASGCPVVASRASALPEVCAEAALYIDPSSSQTIAAALTRLATDADLGRRLQSAGHQRARRFTWRATAEVVYDVLCRAYHARGRSVAAAVPALDRRG